MITGFNMKLSNFAQFNYLFWFYTQMRLFLLPRWSMMRKALPLRVDQSHSGGLPDLAENFYLICFLINILNYSC